MKIAVINTGGTISCVGNPLAPMTAEAFANACKELLDPILQQQFPGIEMTYLTNVSFPESKTKMLDSTNLQPTDWCIMAKGVLDNYASFDGFVILHGTDSMDFTGAALPFLLNAFDTNGYGTAVLSKPVVITGSQVPMYYQAPDNKDLTLNFNTDAYQNFCGVVASARTGVPEVCVYFQNHLYRGNRVLKTNASEFNAFSSPNYPALAEYGVELTLYSENWLPGPVHDSVSLDNADVLTKQQTFVDSINVNIDNFPVMQFNAFPAKYSMSPANAFIADLLNGVVNAGAKGIILKSYGEGNFPSGNPYTPTEGAIYQALNAANESGVNIVDCTQVIAGTVNSSAYAAGAWLPNVGALSPADMSPMASLAKLMILMTSAASNGWTREQVQALLQTNLTGEMKSVNSLDSRINTLLLPGQPISTLDGSATLINDQTHGPLLMGAGTPDPLWCLPTAPSPNDLPGRLNMQNDGNLVFYSRYNKALWATNTGNPAGASSKLILSGHYDANTPANCTLILQVYDYSDMRVSSTLYKSP
jgi:L-asparaginase